MSELLTPDEIGRGVCIDYERYHTDERLHDIADRVLAALGYDLNRVVEMRISPRTISVLTIDHYVQTGAVTETWHVHDISGRRLDGDGND